MSVSQSIMARYSAGKSAEFHYVVRGAADEKAAYDEVRAVVNTAYQYIPLQDIEIETEHFDSTDTAKNIFKATVRYYVKRRDDGDLVSFDTTGGTQKVTQSLQTVGAYPAGSPNLQGAINYDGEKVNGVDIGIGAYDFTEQHIMTTAQCDADYRVVLATLTYTVNNATFRGFAAGEVLFKGAVGQQIVDDGIKKWQLNFRFAVSPNRSNFYVGGILVPMKYGWDYLWTLYADTVDGNRVVKVPAHVYVERLYTFSNFSLLEI